MKATATACANIALVKYWGKRDAARHLPCNGSISLALADLRTVTTVAFEPQLGADLFTLDERPATDAEQAKLGRVLDPLRALAGTDRRARVASVNCFPTAAGLASSAAGFAALAAAGAAALGLDLDEAALSRLARLGSGSACRSVPGGWAEWVAGTDPAGDDSIAVRLAPPDHWPVQVAIALVATSPKAVSSRDGMAATVATSPFYPGWLAAVDADLTDARQAIATRDFAGLADVAERSCLRMHATMLGAVPPLLYWEPATVAVIQAVWRWRQEGLPCFFTIDAGPNVKVFTTGDALEAVVDRLKALPGVTEVRTSGPGAGVQPVAASLF